MVDGGDDVARIIKYFIISTQKKSKKHIWFLCGDGGTI